MVPWQEAIKNIANNASTVQISALSGHLFASEASEVAPAPARSREVNTGYMFDFPTRPTRMRANNASTESHNALEKQRFREQLNEPLADPGMATPATASSPPGRRSFHYKSRRTP